MSFKTVIVATILSIATLNSVHAASSNDTLNACVRKAVTSMSFKDEAKETISSLNESIRDCKESVAEMVKSEKAAKKKIANAKRIKKLKEQLEKLSKA